MKWRIFMALAWTTIAIWVAVTSHENWFAIMLPVAFSFGEAIAVVFRAKKRWRLPARYAISPRTSGWRSRNSCVTDIAWWILVQTT